MCTPPSHSPALFLLAPGWVTSEGPGGSSCARARVGPSCTQQETRITSVMGSFGPRTLICYSADAVEGGFVATPKRRPSSCRAAFCCDGAQGKKGGLRHMPQGTVKWFSQEKGYGFITPDDGGDDLFVHYTGIAGSGFRSLEEGAKVSYEETRGEKGMQAENVTVV